MPYFPDTNIPIGYTIIYDNGIHSPDCKVIVDAHDCGLKYEDLVFVSNDVKMIEILSNMDTSHRKSLNSKHAIRDCSKAIPYSPHCRRDSLPRFR